MPTEVSSSITSLRRTPDGTSVSRPTASDHRPRRGPFSPSPVSISSVHCRHRGRSIICRIFSDLSLPANQKQKLGRRRNHLCMCPCTCVCMYVLLCVSVYVRVSDCFIYIAPFLGICQIECNHLSLMCISSLCDVM